MPKKKNKPKKTRVEKPFNHGTMSNAGFWGMIRSTLRQKSRWWKPIAEAKKLAKRNCKNCGRQKYEYQCANCKQWFSEKEIAVDHIIEAGSLRNGDDLKDFVEKLFCEVDGFQILCNKRKDGEESCHKIKTDEYMKEKRNKDG